MTDIHNIIKNNPNNRELCAENLIFVSQVMQFKNKYESVSQRQIYEIVPLVLPTLHGNDINLMSTFRQNTTVLYEGDEADDERDDETHTQQTKHNQNNQKNKNDDEHHVDHVDHEDEDYDEEIEESLTAAPTMTARFRKPSFKDEKHTYSPKNQRSPKTQMQNSIVSINTDKNKGNMKLGNPNMIAINSTTNDWLSDDEKEMIPSNSNTAGTNTTAVCKIKEKKNCARVCVYVGCMCVCVCVCECKPFFFCVFVVTLCCE